MAKLTIIDNLFTIIAVTLVTFGTILKGMSIRNSMWAKGEAHEIYGAIIEQLKANIDDTPYHGVSESEIKNIISGKVGKDYFTPVWK